MVYKTDNMAVAAYLDLNEIKYKSFELQQGRNGRPIVYFVFEDEKGIAQELERAFRNSKEKKYRDAFFFFRNEVFKALSKEVKDGFEGRE